MPANDYPLTLLNHPTTSAPAVRTIEARVSFRADGSVAFAYRLWGDMARFLVPIKHLPERTDLLWEHTCFEAFIGVHGETAYREFNFSPSGQWANYAFSYYRQRDETLPDSPPPRITAQLYAGRLELEAVVDARSLPLKPGNAHWEIALSAVLESVDTVDGSHSYWALHHAAARPDFHDRAAFTLKCSGT